MSVTTAVLLGLALVYWAIGAVIMFRVEDHSFSLRLLAIQAAIWLFLPLLWLPMWIGIHVVRKVRDI